MSASVSVLRTQIARTVRMTFRKTRMAEFNTPEGWFVVQAWFEDGQPRMQIRSQAQTLEEAAIVAIGIEMAIEWLMEETSKGGNIPT